MRTAFLTTLFTEAEFRISMPNKMKSGSNNVLTGYILIVLAVVYESVDVLNMPVNIKKDSRITRTYPDTNSVAAMFCFQRVPRVGSVGAEVWWLYSIIKGIKVLFMNMRMVGRICEPVVRNRVRNGAVYITFLSSISKISVELPGMFPTLRLPYAVSAGR